MVVYIISVWSLGGWEEITLYCGCIDGSEDRSF